MICILCFGFVTLQTHQLWTFGSGLPGRHYKPYGFDWYLSPLAVFSHVSCAAAMPLTPAGADERSRAARRFGTTLQADRVVLQQTRDRRGKLLSDFDAWLGEHLRVTLECLLDTLPLDCDAIAEALVAYGKDMYNSGKSYGRYSETINAVVARKPTLRRQIGQAWDLAFNWVVDEPHDHHTAMPLSIMLAAVSLALLWGWGREAGLIALMWAGVLRVGEAISAKRRDLILPQDAAPGTWFVLLRIHAPKTRGRAARHQSAKIEPEDIVCLLSAIFSRLPADQPLWPFAPALLRRRFGVILAMLGLDRNGGSQLFTLASLRPGGATHWLQITEDAEFVRRKGRWLSTRVLEIYLQETAFATYQQHLTEKTRNRIQHLCNEFPRILSRVIFFKDNYIPEAAWHRLW